MAIRRVMRWEVPIDDKWHNIGRGKVLHVAIRCPDIRIPANCVEVWTEEDCTNFPGEALVQDRAVQVFGTGHRLDELAWHHYGSVLDLSGRLVWHLYGKVPKGG